MRIAIVNDLRLACVALSQALAAEPRHSIAWTALNGEQAIELARRDRPDLILMDLIMPGIDGVEATRRIMLESPCPILVVTSTVSGNITKVYEAMGHGALDAVETPTLASNGQLRGGSALLEKISQIEKLIQRPNPAASDPRPRSTTGQPVQVDPSAETRLLLIGASTGGPAALATILAALPRSFPAAIVIAQHVDEAYAPGLARWLGERSPLPVELPADATTPRIGHVYLADSKRHLSLGPDRRLRYISQPDGSYRPSIDVLFLSAARNVLIPGVAVLLTGMGRDGADGLLALRRAGWITLAQDQASSVVWGMPKAAIDSGAACHVLPPQLMVPTILTALRDPQSSACRTNQP
ncbi:MAG: chemotaxis response regulator protein-glutamate methylesterase 2 [Isosphaeraceae bacterium]|jgi:two-component system response regulator WspF|nr:MAG: chemotaxis response regulator protein-glutamate methylesterase 2 [Isosphaeraceae bacterium]